MENAVFENDIQLSIDGEKVIFTLVSYGNSHPVVFDDDIKTRLFPDFGAKMEKNTAFRDGVNVEFVRFLAK